jgi:hypothetical protein
MEKTLRVLNKMVKDGVVEQYAIGGAIAATFYIEPLNTNDIDVFFHVRTEVGKLDILAPIYDYLSGLGYSAKAEAIEIEGWPVQFLPVFSPLLDEAVEQANEIRFRRTRTRVMLAEHLVAIMLQTGRPKDFARIHQFLEHNVVDRDRLTDVLERHGLLEQWNARYERGGE